MTDRKDASKVSDEAGHEGAHNSEANSRYPGKNPTTEEVVPVAKASKNTPCIYDGERKGMVHDP